MVCFSTVIGPRSPIDTRQHIFWCGLLYHGMREWSVNARPFQFEWDEVKADANTLKHGVTFELASTIFHDSRLLTVADLEHGDTEERWFSVGCASNGVVLLVVYLWSDADLAATKIRLISARKATQAESRQYQEGL